MKKLLGLLLVTLSTVTLVACGGKTSVPTYRTYTSGTAKLNPYSESLATASELYDLLTDALYEGDYDWDEAIKTGLAKEKGDFTNAAQLPFNYIPAMAKEEPNDVKGDGTVWRFTLREDLKFEDGTAIDAETFNYSWRQLLDPKQLNVRASNLYESASLPILNAEAYVKQLSQKTDKFNEKVWTLNGKTVEVQNAFSHEVGGYELYLSTKEGYYVEYYGPSYASSFQKGYTNWALVTIDANPVKQDASGNLSLLPDGSENPAFNKDTAEAVYVIGRPLWKDTEGNVIAPNADGNPTGASSVANDPVEWSEVGFKVVSKYVFEVTLKEQKDAWYVKQQLSSGITGVVHPEKYQSGLNAAGTSTTYGTIDNPLVSYGPYKLTTWQDDVLYLYDINKDHYRADDYKIKRIRYDVIADQTIAVNEFKAGRLDIVGASGSYYEDFKDSPNLKLTPSTQFMRFAFNIAKRPSKTEVNHILAQAEFREAFYYAIDRQEFVTTVRAPGYANQGFVGPVYVATQYGSTGYRASEAGIGVFASRSPETAGYNPEKAKQLFDQAYNKLVAENKITNGQKVSVEYTYYKVETNDKVANWVKSTVESIFNKGEASPKFELKLTGLSDAALDQAWDNFDFDMTFGGWQGIQFNPISLMGQVYNSISGEKNMLEHGFDTGSAVLTVDLPHTKAALQKWVAEYEAAYPDGAGATDPQKASYARWAAVLAKFGVSRIEGSTLKTTELQATFDEFFKYSSTEFYNVKEVNYEGKNEDFERITAAIEEELLSQMIAIPLFTSVSATVYSDKVVFEATEYHAWMGWGGLKYMTIKK